MPSKFGRVRPLNFKKDLGIVGLFKKWPSQINESLLLSCALIVLKFDRLVHYRFAEAKEWLMSTCGEI